jgi:hypothetical protein
MPAAGHCLTARDIPRPRRDRARCLQTDVGAKPLGIGRPVASAVFSSCAIVDQRAMRRRPQGSGSGSAAQDGGDLFLNDREPSDGCPSA